MSALAVGAGDGVGAGVGLRVGDGVGEGVGAGVGLRVGDGVGAGVGRRVGDGVGAVASVSVGDGLGDVVGDGAGGGAGVRAGVGAGVGERAGDVGDAVAVGIGDGVASDTAVTDNVAVASTVAAAAAARFLDGCASMAAIEWMPGVARFGTFTSTVKLPRESTVAEGMPLDLPSHWSCTFERTAKAVPLTEIVLPAGPDAGEAVIVGVTARAGSVGTSTATSKVADASMLHTRVPRVGRRLGTLDR